MTPPRRPPDDDLLDLPLEPGPGDPLPKRGGAMPEKTAPENLVLFDEVPLDDEPVDEEVAAARVEETTDTWTTSFDTAPMATGIEPATAQESVTGSQRWMAGMADVAIHVGVLAATALALLSLGVRPAPGQWPGFLLFLIAFSFVYVTLPLAFWGQTPGMAWVRLQARDRDDRPLTFGQSVVRWLIALLSVPALGLPALVFGSRPSLSDRVTDSVTHRLPAGAD